MSNAGRADAATELQEVLELARRGRGGSVLLLGEAGIGKSRLLRDTLLATSPSTGDVTLVGRAVALGGEPVCHAALVDVLQQAGALDGDSSGFGPDILRERLLALVPAAAPGSSLVVVIDDLQWTDRSTCETLALFARRVVDRHAALVLSCRDDELPKGHFVRQLTAELRQARLLRVVRLPRMAPIDAAVLIDEVTGGIDDASAAALYQRSAGNPLLLKELSEANARGRDVCDLPTVDVLLARFERLSEPGRRAAEAVAVAGTDVDAVALDEVLGAAGQPTASSGVREALEHHLLVRRGDAVGFRHALVAEAVRDHHLLPTERRRLHHRWANALEGGDGPASILAHHWSAAGNAERALAASVAAGDLATTALAPHEAWAHYSRALRWWSSVDDPARRGTRSFVELSTVAAEAAHRSGDRRAAIEVLAAARSELDRGDDAAEASRLAERTGWYLLRESRPDDALEQYREALALLPADAPASTRAEVLAGCVRAAEHCRDGVLALRSARAAVAASASDPQTSARAHYMLARALLVAGDAGAAEAAFALATELAEEAADLATLVAAVSDRADILAAGRRLAIAIADASACSVRLRDRGLDEPGALVVSAVAAGLELRQGRVQAARARADAIVDRSRLPITTALGHLLAGSCELVAGRPTRAREHLELARFLAAPMLDGRLAGALALARAELALAEGLLDEASARVDDGIAATLTSGDDELRGRLALLGVRAADDRSRSLDRRAVKRALERAEGDRDRCIRLAEDVVRGRVDQPGYAPIAAELAAWTVPPDADGAEAWLRAAAAWRGVEWPTLDVRARIHAAVTLLRSGERARAAKVLGEAAADAAHAEDAAGAAAARRIAERAGVGPIAATAPAPSAASAAPLTAREREVLELVADGATNRRIATTLFISEKTARVHVSRILTKLGVTSRHAAVAAARRPA